MRSHKPQAISLTLPTKKQLANSRVLVAGLGRAGLASARWLVSVGARVWGYDADSRVLASREVAGLKSQGLRTLTASRLPLTAKDQKKGRSAVGGERSAGFDFAVVSPGISTASDLAKELASRRIPVVDELDLASQFVPGKVIAVTGTNGKSTTVALIGHVLSAAGHEVFVGGNLAPGRPLSDALSLPACDCYVVEVSSFQLERSRWFAPRVGVLLNVSEDHLNRHASLAEYAEFKYRLFDRQLPTDWAILNREDPKVMAAKDRGKAARRYFSDRRRVSGAYLDCGWLVGEGPRVMRAAELPLAGRHNVQNALAAIAACHALGVPAATMRRALGSFHGLPHRLEFVASVGGVRFINNSMCTNPAAGISSLAAFSEPVVLITGGREKGLDENGYVREIAKRARWAVLLGESAAKLGRLLAKEGFFRFQVAADLCQAVRMAHDRAGRGDVVLFSPAFASFDQFKDFQARGDAFKREVRRTRTRCRLQKAERKVQDGGRSGRR